MPSSLGSSEHMRSQPSDEAETIFRWKDIASVSTLYACVVSLRTWQHFVNFSILCGYGSKPFKFIIEGKPMYIHRARVTSVSRPLDSLMNGNMIEAETGEAVLEDVDRATFARFCQWVYEGYYDAAVHRDCPKDVVSTEQTVTHTSSTTAATQSPPLEDGALIRPGPLPRPILPKYAGNPELRKYFLGLKFCEASDERLILRPRPNASSSEDYTEVFLSHARVYVFAEKFDIQPLKRLALKILHETLIIFSLHPQRVNDIVALIEFVYNETCVPVKGSEPMRDMLKHLMSVYTPVLSEEKGFRDLLEENRDVLDDYCSCVVKVTKKADY